MMGFGIIWDFVIQLVFLLLLIGVAAFIIKKGIGKANKSKTTYWIMGGYLCLLLLSVGVYVVTPELQGQEKTGNVDEPDFDNMIFEGAPVDIDNKYKVKEWDFDYDDEEISLHYTGDDQNNVPIRLDRRQNQDKIEAVYYQTPTYYNGINITPYIDPVRVNKSGDELSIELPEMTYLEFTSYKKEFPFKQLTAEGFWDNDDFFGEVEISGSQFLYLRIPENMKVNADSNLEVYEEGRME